METPAPVNVSLLKDILAKSKAIMAKTEEKSTPKKASRQRVNEDYEEDYRNQPVYDERDEREPEYKTPTLSDYQPTIQQPKMYTAEQVMASNLPQVVKEAMIKNPIPQLQGPPSKFTLEDMSDLVEKPAAKPRKQINENVRNSNDMITISRTELKELINESISQFFTQAYNKNLTEAAIKKTISTLINEGKLNVKKK
jgi:hypothetical protein